MKVQEDTQEAQLQINRSEWRPLPSAAGRRALAVSSALALCSALAWAYLLAQPVGVASIFAALVGTVGALAALGAAAITAGYYSMRYRLEAERLTISCLWMREIVPMGRIDGVYGGRRLGRKARIKGLSLPGFYIGTAFGTELERARFCGTSTSPLTAVVITAAEQAYVITPVDAKEFRSQLVGRLEALAENEPEQAPEPVSEGTIVPKVSLFQDRVGLSLVAAALVVLLASFAYVGFRLGSLPSSIPLHFDSAGRPDVIVPKADALRIPIIGMFILVVNWLVAAGVHAWQRDAGRVMAGATLFVELIALMAVLLMVH